MNNKLQTTRKNENSAMNNVAMLIDWENIKATALDFLHTPPDIITLKKIARTYGTLRVAKAYANWTDPSGWHAGDAERLSAQGIEPVFVSTRYFKSGEYEKDLVDLRLACDGMELAAMHPEIGCFVVVSGDGALETLLTKLSARGKHIVRVAVRQSLGRGIHVLGEERVIYDDWIKGFRVTTSEEVTAAAEKLADAVKAITENGDDNGLHSVKEWMRRNDPDFEEERLGIPTFRHLAYIAETLGLARIDARMEPAQAYCPDVTTSSDKVIVPSGAAWKFFISQFEPRTDYDKFGFESCFSNQGGGSEGLEGIPLADMREIAIRSDVLSRVSSKHITREQRTWYTDKVRLNLHHPRVQVVLAGT